MVLSPSLFASVHLETPSSRLACSTALFGNVVSLQTIEFVLALVDSISHDSPSLASAGGIDTETTPQVSPDETASSMALGLLPQLVSGFSRASVPDHYG